MDEKSRVLLIEDDLFHRELLAEGLKDYYNYHVVAAEDLEHAEELLRELTPDLIVLDCVLGDYRFESMDWAEGLLRYRPEFSETPILFVTAFYNEMEERAKRIQRSAILAKPFTFDGVTLKMRELLASKA